MNNEVISFRTGQWQHAEILAECDRNNITITEYMHRKLSTAKIAEATNRRIKRDLKSTLRLINLFNNPTAAANKLEDLIEWMEAKTWNQNDII